MKKILLIVLAVVVAAGLVALFVYKQQSGYTKVLTARIAKQELTTVVSGTGTAIRRLEAPLAGVETT